MNDEPGTASADATAYDLAFTLEERDYIAFMTVARRSGIEKVMMMIFVIGACATGAFAGWVLTWTVLPALNVDSEVWGIVPVLAGIAAAPLVYRWWLQPAYVRSFLEAQPVGMGPARLIADKAAVTGVYGGTTLVTPWVAVQRVVDRPDHVFLLFARLVGHIVPKRTFASPQEAEAFVAFLRERTPAQANRD